MRMIMITLSVSIITSCASALLCLRNERRTNNAKD